MAFTQHLTDVQAEEMVNEFKRFFNLMMPDDRDIFLQKLIEEVEQIKKQEQEKEIAKELEKEQTKDQTPTEAADTTDNPQATESKELDEAIALQEQAQSEQNIEKSQEVESQGIADDELGTALEADEEQALEQAEVNNTFEDKIQDSLEDFISKNENELREMGMLKDNEQDGVRIYNNDFLLDEKQLTALKADYDNAPDKEQWQPSGVFDMDSLKQKHQDSQNFIDGFMNEVKEISEQAPSMAEDKKLNPNTYFKDLVDWFDKKKMENYEMPINKETFKQEFFDYCKNGMSENEMKILLLLQHKEPSTLSKEHKDMINQGLKYNLQNNKLLDKGLESAITASVGEKLTNENANEFVKSAVKMEKSENLIDKKMCEGTNQKIAKQIKENSPNLWQETNKKLNAVIDNKTQGLEKTANIIPAPSAALGMGR